MRTHCVSNKCSYIAMLNNYIHMHCLYTYVIYYTDCPEMKQLQHVMRIENIKITASWYELGLELLVSDNDLEVINVNNPLNVTACCCKMFDKWLKRTPDASWKQLVTALRNIKLYAAANAVSEYCKSGNCFLY